MIIITIPKENTAITCMCIPCMFLFALTLRHGQVLMVNEISESFVVFDKLFDKLFDAHNTNNVTERKYHQKPLQDMYSSDTD